MKKILIALAIVVLLLLGAAAGYYWYDHRAPNIRGSSTEEFVTTQETTPKPVTRTPAIVWPTFGYDNERVKSAPGFDLQPPFKIQWAFPARKLLEFPPVIAYGKLYISNAAGTVFAIEARTGNLKWKYEGHRCTAASPAVENGIVYEVFLNKPPCNRRGSIQDLEGEIVALHARGGKVQWRRTIGASETSPAVAGKYVYVGDWRGKVYAFRVRTGKLRWTFQTGGAVKGGVAISGSRLYVGSYDGHLYALNRFTGKQIWRASSQPRFGGTGTFYATPAVAYGRVYIGSTDHKVYSYGATTGKLRWSYGTGSYVYSSPAVWQLRVYVGSHDHHLYCFDAATGAVRWRYDAHGVISGAPTVINGVVYFSTANNVTFALDARTGKPLWRFPDGQYTPAVADSKKLYLVGHTRLFAMLPKSRG